LVKVDRSVNYPILRKRRKNPTQVPPCYATKALTATTVSTPTKTNEISPGARASSIIRCRQLNSNQPAKYDLTGRANKTHARQLECLYTKKLI